MSDLGGFWQSDDGIWTGGVYAPEAGGRRDPQTEAKRRCLGLQAPGGRPPLNVQFVKSAPFVSATRFLH